MDGESDRPSGFRSLTHANLGYRFRDLIAIAAHHADVTPDEAEELAKWLPRTMD